MLRIPRSFVIGIMFSFLLTIGLGGFTDSYARDKRLNPTQSNIKNRGTTTRERAGARWNSLTPEEQDYFEQKASAKAGEAKMTGEEYWNSLSDDEKEAAVARSRERAKKGRKRWQNLPAE